MLPSVDDLFTKPLGVPLLYQSSMSWLSVDFNSVRYSALEGTHYFYDPALPQTVQFLLSGRWEAWDVGWVKHKAQDPDIRRVAEEAEARLIQDPNSGYVPWTSPPPPGLLRSTSSDRISSQPNFSAHPAESSSASSPPNEASTLQHPQPISPPIHGLPSAAGRPRVYTSPYAQHPASTPSQSSTPTVTASAVSTTPVSGRSSSIAGTLMQLPLHDRPPHASAPPGAVTLSRTRETKILLSIDGDGIRGLSALLLIESLVNAICVKVGQRLDAHQIFDLTGGSSLGGVIAILLCRLRMQAHRAREAYKKIARQVFQNKRDFFVSLDPYAQTPNVDGLALETEIKTFIQQELGDPNELLLDGRDDSGDVFVVSTHIEIGTNKPALMRSYQSRRITGPELDAEMPIWQALKATSVAPRYMTPQAGINQRLVIQPGLVDHGTAKNNPVRDILYECRKLFRYANDMMIIVSVGTGSGIDRKTEIPEMANSVEDRNAEARTWGEKFEQDHTALMERGWMKYFRFNVPGLEDVPLEEWRHEDVLREKTSAYLAQPEVGQMFYACVDAITALLLRPPSR